MAAPIRDHDDTVIGSIGISAPIARFPESRYAECARQVKESARQIGLLVSVQAD